MLGVRAIVLGPSIWSLIWLMVRVTYGLESLALKHATWFGLSVFKKQRNRKNN